MGIGGGSQRHLVGLAARNFGVRGAQEAERLTGEDRDNQLAGRNGFAPGRSDRKRTDTDAGGDGERHIRVPRTIAARCADCGMRRCH